MCLSLPKPKNAEQKGLASFISVMLAIPGFIWFILKFLVIGAVDSVQTRFGSHRAS